MACLSQDINFKEYSYTEFFNLIDRETDSIFKMENALIKYNEGTDSLFMLNPPSDTTYANPGVRNNPRVIKKEVQLDNVHFLTDREEHFSDVFNGALDNILFEQKVSLRNIANVEFNHCTFEKRLTIRGGNKTESALKSNQFNIIGLKHSFLMESGLIVYMLNDHVRSPGDLSIDIRDNTIHLKMSSKDQDDNRFDVLGMNFSAVRVWHNTFTGNGLVRYKAVEMEYSTFSSNTIEEAVTELFINRPSGWDVVDVENNSFNNDVFWGMNTYSPRYSIPYTQFKDHLMSSTVLYDYLRESKKLDNTWWNSNIDFENMKMDVLKNDLWYKTEVSSKGMLYDFYKSKHDNEDANKVYMQIKDLETERLNYLYNQNPSFKTYFKWKVNQFLKVFSDYGTEPSKAIVFSVYVILCFAFIYLFFPNSWDKHGRNRIMNRYSFFMKYMRRDAGMHQVYLDDKEPELLEYEDFKTYLTKSKNEMPKFFVATGLPLYKWAVSGTKTYASFLKRIDIMNGTWKEVPTHKRFWKSILLITAFLIALVYDIFIKIVNALMLSINTFTTLGFGEIPIKGLPRYLAIVEGFIGWFMLTIFSVSLISQLLN
jgi:hypothetical protein